MLKWLKSRFRRTNPSGPTSGVDWKALLDTDRPLWTRSLEAARKGPKVLVATSVGGHGPASVLESMLAAALTLRGAQVHILLCDSVLPGCLKAEYAELPDPGVLERYELPKTLCQGCMRHGDAVYGPLGLPIHRIGALVEASERDEARRTATGVPARDRAAFRFRDMAVGEHAHAGALRYFARGDLAAEAKGDVIAQRYLEASLLTAVAMERLLTREKFDAALFHHGLYVPQGIIGEACRKHGVRVSNWSVGYRRNTFIFSHHDTYHHTLLSEPASTWEDLPWSDAREAEILAYLKSRWQGNRDWIFFQAKAAEDLEAFARERGIDPAKPLIGMLSNVVWDAQLHYRANAFPGMIDWAVRTVAWFAKRPDLQLLLRIHPAEIRGTSSSRQPLLAELQKAFPSMPPNVFIIPPESAVSTYAAMERCDSVIIYGTKTGVELTSVGIPVIVAGEAWIRNKGLTTDASSPEEYLSILGQLPLKRRMDDATVRRARRYAYHFFFRRMIPLPFMAATPGRTLFKIDVKTLADLGPGRDAGLDVLCDGVLKAAPYVFPAERLGIHDI